MKVLLNAKQIDSALNKLTNRIVADIPQGVKIAVIGIRSRGEIVAQRLAGRLSKKIGSEIPCGTLDITLYRDDLNSPKSGSQPKVRTTEIRFDIPESVHAELRVFNILGQEVAKLVDEVQPAGAYRILWNSKSGSGTDVASGIYIYQLKAGKFVSSKKMMLIR